MKFAFEVKENVSGKGKAFSSMPIMFQWFFPWIVHDWDGLVKG